MENIVKSQGDNPAGISKIEFAPIEAIAFFPELDPYYPYGINIFDFTFTGLSGMLNFLKLPFTLGSGRFLETDKPTDAGKVFSQVVSCSSTLDGTDLNAYFSSNGANINEMDLTKFIVVVTKMDGTSYMCGTKDNPMNLTVNKRADGLGNGSNTYDFIFYIDAIKRAPVAVFY